MFTNGAVPLSPFLLLVHIWASCMVLNDGKLWNISKIYVAISNAQSMSLAFYRAQTALFIFLFQASCIFDFVVVRLSRGHEFTSTDVGRVFGVYEAISILILIIFLMKTLLIPKSGIKNRIVGYRLFGAELYNAIFLIVLLAFVAQI